LPACNGTARGPSAGVDTAAELGTDAGGGEGAGSSGEAADDSSEVIFPC
jgi:hypothetical protein